MVRQTDQAHGLALDVASQVSSWSCSLELLTVLSGAALRPPKQSVELAREG